MDSHSDTQADWFSLLSIEDQNRLAPSYILLLKQQLAQAEVRHERLMTSLRHYDPEPHPDSISGKMVIAGRYKYRTCRNCLQTSLVDEVWSCDGCLQWGCIKCNRSDKKVIQCEDCHSCVCEKCDAGILDEDLSCCVGCTETSSILRECARRLKQLKKGEITRSQATIKWIVGGYPLNDPEKDGISQNHWILVDRSLCQKRVVTDSWRIFLQGDEDADEKLFEVPEDGCVMVLVPRYHCSPRFVPLVNQLIRKFVPGERFSEYLEVIFNDFRGPYQSRFDITTLEVIRTFINSGDEHITEEKLTRVTQEDPEFLQRIFE